MNVLTRNFKVKDIHSLKGKGFKKIDHTSISQKKARIIILISDKLLIKELSTKKM